MRDRLRYAVQNACIGGNLEVVKELVETFGLTAADVRTDGDYALIRARAEGHTAVVEWLTKTYGKGYVKEAEEEENGEEYEREVEYEAED